MLVIRLQRTGRKNLATYRIVVAEKARAAKGRFHEIVGHYLPTQKDGVFSFDKERISHWVGHGAVPSETVARLLKKNGMDNMDKFIKSYAKRRSKNAPPEEDTPPPAPAAAAEAAPAAEEPQPEPAAEAPVEQKEAEEAPKEEPVEEPKKEEEAPAVEEKKEEVSEEPAPAQDETPAEQEEGNKEEETKE